MASILGRGGGLWPAFQRLSGVVVNLQLQSLMIGGAQGLGLCNVMDLPDMGEQKGILLLAPRRKLI